MRHIQAGTKRRAFDVLFATRSAQAAMMTLRPGSATDDEAANEHAQCEQWLFVTAGRGEAIIGKSRRSLRRIPLRKHSLLLIEKRELHRIRNTGRAPLRAISFYVPPAYTAAGEPR